jgi:hypothetical protein
MMESIQNDVMQKSRPIPQSELDFNLMTTNTEWGGQYIPEVLKSKLQREYIEVRADGKQYIKKEGLWELLGFYTRDMRLANLSEFNGEMAYCVYYLDLANDFLRDDFIEPFLICLSRAATRLELSQSKQGFLRRRMNTLTQEHYQQELEPKKKNFFGMAKKE